MADPAPVDPGGFSTVLCDLDGVVWLAHDPIPGAADAIERLRRSGRRVLFVTNNSMSTVAEQESALDHVGIGAAGDVVTSAMAGARLVEPGERVLVAGGPGVVEAVERRGAIALRNDGATDHGRVDAVLVGLHRDFDYARLRSAARAVLGGARLIGTNSDSTFPTPGGLDPGGGSLVTAVATVAGVEPVFGGKPHAPMGDVIADVLDAGGGSRDLSHALMVGDRPDTDGLFAETVGAPFALVRTGVLRPDQPAPGDVPVAVDLPDLAAVADLLLGARG